MDRVARYWAVIAGTVVVSGCGGSDVPAPPPPIEVGAVMTVGGYHFELPSVAGSTGKRNAGWQEEEGSARVVVQHPDLGSIFEVRRGRLWIDGTDACAIEVGDTVVLAPDGRVLRNGVEVGRSKAVKP